MFNISFLTASGLMLRLLGMAMDAKSRLAYKATYTPCQYYIKRIFILQQIRFALQRQIMIFPNCQIIDGDYLILFFTIYFWFYAVF